MNLKELTIKIAKNLGPDYSGMQVQAILESLKAEVRGSQEARECLRNFLSPKVVRQLESTSEVKRTTLRGE